MRHFDPQILPCTHLYNQAGGAGWPNTSGWLNPNATAWYGVTIEGVQYDTNGNVAVQGNVWAISPVNNNLSGTLPSSLGNLSKLQDLYLDNNQLGGSIPSSFGNLASLNYLYLAGNQLSGSIPSSLGNLSTLQVLFLDANQLTGSIPTSLGNLSSIQVLTLANNQLTGNIPPSFAGLTQLAWLDLSDNQLTGDVPIFSGPLSYTANLVVNWLQITPGTQSRANIDQMIAAGKNIVYSPQNGVAVTPLRVSNFTADVKASNSIDAPIAPVTIPTYLSTASPLGMGVVADDVTPVLFQFNGTATNYTLQITHNATSYNGLLSAHLFVLQNGAWTPTISFTISSSSTPAYAYLSGLTWTDFSGTPADGVTVTVNVYLPGGSTPVANTNFLVRPPPIALVHGIADDNTTWSADFTNTLAIIRPTDFIVPVQYGVGSGSDKTKWPNAYDRFDNLSLMLDDALQQQFEIPLRANWSFTRYDVVGHSQGGVLLRMLCQTDRTGTVAPFTADRSPVVSANNFYRGRFRRVVTIGSPQNGSLIAWYIINMQTTADFSPIINAAWFSALSSFNQPTFDPFGSQIAEINNPLWPIDSRIKFNCIRTTISGGAAPSLNVLQNPPVYDLLGLWFPIVSGMSRGQVLVPNGSDGIVDFASEGGGANTSLTTITDNNIAHANIVPIPGIFELFGVPLGQSQTTFGEVAGDVGTLLNGPVGNFGPFQLPTLHSPADLQAYQSILPSSIIVNGLIQFLPHPLFVSTNVSLALTTPANLPSAGPINWCAQVFGTNGLSTNGITVQVSTNDSTQVTVSVDSSVLGQVVLFASYVATNGTLVFASPVVVVSYAPGTTLNGIELTSPAATLSVGDVLSTSIWGDYTNGTRCLLYIPGGQASYGSSNTNVATVSANGTITLNALGTATITATYQGFMAQTVVSSAPTIIGNLYGSITTNGTYQLSLYSSAGTTNIIQTSTNLINWSVLATIYSTNGLIQFQDNAKMQMRFYRVQQQ